MFVCCDGIWVLPAIFRILREGRFIKLSNITREWNISNIVGAPHKSSTIQTPSYAMMNYLISYFLTLFFPVAKYRYVKLDSGGSYLFISVYLANPFTLISKIASIAAGTDSMRLGAGWASLFRLPRGLHTFTRHTYSRLGSMSLFRFYNLPHPGCQPGSLTVAHSASLSLRSTWVQNLVASLTGQFDYHNFFERYLTSWVVFSSRAKFLKSEV